MPTPPTPVVTFNAATWKAMFPQFDAVPDPVANGYFLRAGLLFTNSASNPAYRDGNMETLFYLLVSHIATLSAPAGAAGTTPSGPQLVGRLTSASQGSVSVGAQWDGSGSPSEAWFLQTQFGAEFWQATAQYRTARYLARPTYVPGSFRNPFIPPWGWRT